MARGIAARAAPFDRLAVEPEGDPVDLEQGCPRRQAERRGFLGGRGDGLEALDRAGVPLVLLKGASVRRVTRQARSNHTTAGLATPPGNRHPEAAYGFSRLLIRCSAGAGH